jgi:hypothetical protein
MDAHLVESTCHSLLRRCPTSRDFVPWRAGQLSVRSLLVAGVQKPAQQQTHAVQQVTSLFDHLVGTGEYAPGAQPNRWRNFRAK